MPNITSFETLELAIQQVGGTPKVLEALWDGDTQGWYLCLSVYVEKGIWPFKRTERHALGTVTLGTDIRLFSGQVPPWPEVELVTVFVEQTQARYGLTLYLPSEEPDDDCPAWTAREYAIACADCGKIIIPSGSEYLPQDICYNCHLKREQKKRIQQAEPCDDSVTLYLYQNGVYRSLAYATCFDSLPIASYLKPTLLQSFTSNAINVVTLEHEALVEIQTQLAEALEENLASHEPAEKNTPESHFHHFTNIVYQSIMYELEIKWHDSHQKISELFHNWNTIQQAIESGACYKLYFKRGINHRDDSLLRFLKYPSPSHKSLDQILNHYYDILSKQEVMNTLAKLEELKCLKVEGTDVNITQTGINIV